MSRDLVVALSGGIGGAKLALGLSRIVKPDNLIIVANVGDDFEHLGLHIATPVFAAEQVDGYRTPVIDAPISRIELVRISVAPACAYWANFRC
jgi:hypothetical protein